MAEGREFAKILRSIEQFIQTEMSEKYFGNRMLFNLLLEVFSSNYYRRSLPSVPQRLLDQSLYQEILLLQKFITLEGRF